MSFVTVKGEIYCCNECKAVITVDFIEGLTALQVGDEEVFRQGLWFSDSKYLHYEGVCEECYRLKYNDPVDEAKVATLMSQMELYARNISNIQREGFNQVGATKTFYRYRQLLRERENELKGRPRITSIKVNTTKNYHPFFAGSRFQRTPVPDTPNVMFYFIAYWYGGWRDALDRK